MSSIKRNYSTVDVYISMTFILNHVTHTHKIAAPTIRYIYILINHASYFIS